MRVSDEKTKNQKCSRRFDDCIENADSQSFLLSHAPTLESPYKPFDKRKTSKPEKKRKKEGCERIMLRV